MKYKPPRSVAIFFCLFLQGRGGGHCPLGPPLDPLLPTVIMALVLMSQTKPWFYIVVRNQQKANVSCKAINGKVGNVNITIAIL